MLLALVLCLHQAERFLALPMLPYPGVKLGLSNLVTLLSLFLLTPGQAFIFVILRSLLIAAFGGFSLLIFSLTGALLAFILMFSLGYAFPQHFSLVGLSIGGAVMHNIGQILVACVFSKSFAIFLYLPMLLGSGVIGGFAIGIITRTLIKTMQKSALISFDPKLEQLL